MKHSLLNKGRVTYDTYINIKAVYKVLAGNLERIFVHPSLMQTALAEATSNKRTDTSSILREFSNISICSTGMEAFDIFA